MRILCLALLVLACSLFTSTTEAGVEFSVDEGSMCIESSPVVINGLISMVHYQQQPVVIHESYEFYQTCSYEGECNTKDRKGFYKSHRQYDDDDG